MNAELTLHDYWRIVNRRKWIALFIFVITVVSTLFYTKLQPTIYKSNAIIRFQPPASYSKILGSSPMEWDSWGAVVTEIKIITSGEISRRAELKMKERSDYKADKKLAAYNAEMVKGSNLISIYATSSNPIDASDTINLVIESYRDYDFEQKSAQATKTLDDISARKAEIEQNLRSKEKAKKDFLEKNPRTGLGSAFANQLANFEVQKKELLRKYTPNHSSIININQRIEVLQNKLAQLPATEMVLARISRELRMQEQLYTILNKQYEEAKLGLAAIVSFVSVVNPAFPASSPISPNKQVNMIVGIFLGIFLSLVIVFLLENLDVSISTIEDIEDFLKLPVLGIIPNIASDKYLDNWLINIFKKERYTTEAFRSVLIFNRKYASNAIESYHTLRTNIISQMKTKESFAIVFSSAGAAEGKTLTAVNFALASAHSGLKTLLVDADMRRPSIYNIFGINRQPGLSDILEGQVSWKKALYESSDLIGGSIGLQRMMRFSGMDNLSIINSGTSANNIIDVIDYEQWDDLIKDFKSEFDIVVFDSPPVLLFVDSLIISKHVDGVVLVYKAGKIARGALKRAKEQISGANARMIGVALNGVRASEMGAQYGYYQYDYDKYGSKR
ncbi:MAG: polysaccharide biosynthesis tyrosine autokinase, partial [Elusimicrobiales bacterium]|nr:polysaccharide biosynthesis tyrosine autokinase [Elusimicrobiales bacterium]